jgi:hypothetical protein
MGSRWIGLRENHMADKTAARRFPDLLQARCPETLPPLIKRAASRQCMSPAEYIRRSVFERLKADGIDVGQLMVA